MRFLPLCLLFAAFVAFGQPADSLRTNPELFTDALFGTFVLVKGGSFEMGSNEGDPDEKPVHRVTLNDYYIAEAEVTQAQWKAIMGNNPSRFGGCDECPVERVSWNDIQNFLIKLNSSNGGVQYRLPTEAEWEYAARGGNLSKGYLYAGSNTLDDVVWHKYNAGNKTNPVKGKAPNELGLYDMSGNVWEWCSDWYGYYTSKSQTNPTGSSTDIGPGHVFRGGSWYMDPQNSRVANRSGAPEGRSRDVGFRLARSVNN